ncbi:MAG TPA: HNH endonuclease [Lacipirellulaceae bacterium]|nr:HNH endonuclease [Lacipirellulaceae bacterium]
MPDRPLRKCCKPGCRNLTRSARCEAHATERAYSTRSRRSAEAQQLYTHAWTKAAAAFRKANPLCAECQRQGRTTPAYCVDHIIPHRGDPGLFWAADNWQSLCRSCHATKTARGG